MSKHKPRSGSKAFYPRVRAKKQTPSFKTYPVITTEKAKPLNFFGYKSGMTHLIAKDDHAKTTTFGQNIVMNGTMIEVPPIKVFGIRAYKKTYQGLQTISEIWAEKKEKHLSRKIIGLKTRNKPKKEKKVEGTPKIKKTISDLELIKNEIESIRLLIHTQPYLTGIGKKKPEVAEIVLSGNVEQQLEFAKQKLGNEIKIDEVFKDKQFVDVRAVTTGKGFQGVVKRYGVKTFRPKSKKSRVVGSISPWHPKTVMWTVGRPGQMGYHVRTEYNKKIMLMSNSSAEFNPKAGLPNYGNMKNEMILLAGSIPGPVKRLIAIREPIRPVHESKAKVSEISYISVRGS
ncbi:MAG: 50S ribosomal protein L3 [archaeon]|nr:50S ribosomal protein L3 [archaeon]